MYEFSWLDITPYMLMTIILIAIVNCKGEPQKKAWICFLLMFVFAAIRYGIGYDYYGYMNAALHQVKQYTLDRYEPLSRLLVEIAFHTHYQMFFILGSFLTLYPLYKVCVRLSVNPAYSLLIYFLFPSYYLESLSIVRNAIAYSFVFFAYMRLADRKVFHSLVWLLVACFFHKSAVIGVLIYPVFYIKNNRLLHLLIFLFSFMAQAIIMHWVEQYSSVFILLSDVERYAEHGRSEGGMMTYIINGLTIVNFAFWNKLVTFDKRNSIYLSLFNVGTFIWNVFLGVDSTIALRLSSFLQIFIILLVPCYAKACELKYRKFVRVSSYYFFFFFFVSSFVINIYAYLQKPDRMSNLPYQTIFYYTDYTNYVY